jgi:hypothetical protein
MNDDEPCGRPIYVAPDHDATPVCLMHSRDPEKSDAAFQHEFETILNAAGDGVADFSWFVFPSANYAGREFAAESVFHGTTFVRVAMFSAATFRHGAIFYSTTFTQDAYFDGAKFTQLASFGGCTFSQGAHFNSAKFAHAADFRVSTFTQDAYFRISTFAQDASFVDATFALDAAFRGATFTQNAEFFDATFSGDADFGFATFTQFANFNDAAFMQQVRFMRTKFGGAAEFRETHFRQDGKPLPGPIFYLAEFSQPEAVIFYRTYLGQALFHNCDVSRVSLSSVRWRQRKGSGKRMVFEEEVDLEAAKDLRPVTLGWNERDYGLVAELYQQLKKNYDERKDYWTAGDFHYGEMEMKRLASTRKNKILRWLVQHLRLVEWYKYASQYGESYNRPAIWLGTTLLFFALLFPAVGLRYDSTKVRAGTAASSDPVILTYARPLFPGQPDADRHKAQWRLFGNSFLTALEIAAFQKEPAYQPVYPWGRLLTLIETLLTSTLAALFFLAVRRQFRR